DSPLRMVVAADVTQGGGARRHHHCPVPALSPVPGYRNPWPRQKRRKGAKPVLTAPFRRPRMKKALLTSVGVVAIGAAGLLWLATKSGAARPVAKAEQKEARSASLPIGQVVLYSSGVGYFQREGSVEGDSRVDLSFPVSDINDLIKSMVLRDLDGGHVSAVSYDSNAPVERTLRSFAVDLTRNPSLAELLNQARGEKVEVALAQGGAASSLSGTIVGVEAQRQVVGKEPVES